MEENYIKDNTVYQHDAIEFMHMLYEEFGDEFATKEKPWMKSRFTAMLPIKFDVVRNEE